MEKVEVIGKTVVKMWNSLIFHWNYQTKTYNLLLRMV